MDGDKVNCVDEITAIIFILRSPIYQEVQYTYTRRKVNKVNTMYANLHLSMTNRRVASMSVHNAKFLERKLKHNTDMAMRQQRRANENFIFKIMQFVKWVVALKHGSPLKTKMNCKEIVTIHPKFWNTGST